MIQQTPPEQSAPEEFNERLIFAVSSPNFGIFNARVILHGAAHGRYVITITELDLRKLKACDGYGSVPENAAC